MQLPHLAPIGGAGSRLSLARPYICRFMSLRRVIYPSVWPFIVGVSRRWASDDVVSNAAVVNVAFAPERFNAVYATNKSFVLALTPGLSAELGGRWHAVRACAPPLTRS
ncbi:hypothetical protein MPPM_0206 [Methylorubrum populi]|uniref:Uncharacterized protein n=1 Tax=Methylorubrum populi TaxID=223967 RepID=A0A160PBT5_9HYPH|nr:hypothetical protein MPPM_0206 [Methylorubrum populi]